MKDYSSVRNRCLAVVVGLVATTYIATSNAICLPMSAELVADRLVIQPDRDILRPLWSLGVECLDALLRSERTVRFATACSTLFAGASVALMYWLMSGMPRNRSAEEMVGRANRRVAQLLTGVSAALGLAFCPPFWFAATNAHPAAFHIFLLLGCVGLCQWAVERDDLRSYLLWALVYGFAAAEFAVLALLAPWFALVVGLRLWRRGMLSVQSVMLIGSCGLVGALLLLSMLSRYATPDILAAYSLPNFPALVWAYVKAQGLHLLRSMPRIGWLMVLLFSIVPWFLVAGFPRGTYESNARQSGSILLHGVLTVIGALIILNLTVAPFALYGFRPLLVTPYIFVASWFGYLVGYWYILCSREMPLRNRWWDPIRKRLAPLILPAHLALVGSAAILLYPSISPTQALPMAATAEYVVDSLGGRTWLITNGVLDGNILLAAHERGLDLQLLDATRFREKRYRRMIGRRFDAPRLRAMAEVGLGPLLQEWKRMRPDMMEDIALLGHGDLWFHLDSAQIPEGPLFVRPEPDSAIDASGELKRMRAIGELLDAPKMYTPPMDVYAAWTRTYIAKMANNLGFYLESEGNWQPAADAYRTARAINPENVSALLNLLQLARSRDLPDAEAIEADYATFAEGLSHRLGIWSLSAIDGYVRHPAAFVEQGLAWAMSGKPNVGIDRLREAIQLGAPAQPLEAALAVLLAEQGEAEQSQAMWARMLERDPEDPRALLGLARHAVRAGSYLEARTYLVRLLETGAAPTVARNELARIYILLGNLGDAQRYLAENQMQEPKDHRTLLLLASIAARHGSDDERKGLTRQLEALQQPSATSWTALALLAEADREWDLARSRWESVLNIRPHHRDALRRLLQLAYLQRDQPRAEQIIVRLLEIDPTDAFANLMLGSLQLARKQYDLAKSSFRASIESQPSAAALNDLAWILLQQGHLEEALQTVDQALELDPANGHALDTRGMVLFRLERYHEAEASIRRALARLPRHPGVALHLAQIFQAQGRIQEAAQIADSLLTDLSQLDPDIRDQASELRRELRGEQTGAPDV